MMPSEARPPCSGEASPIPQEPSSQWILTQGAALFRPVSWRPADLERLDFANLHGIPRRSFGGLPNRSDLG